jgi:hypothetical protein
MDCDSAAVRLGLPCGGKKLRAAAAHLHRPTLLQCRERNGHWVFRDVEAWLAAEPAGLWVLLLDKNADDFGVAFDDLADVGAFKLCFVDTIEIVEIEPDELSAD